MLYVPEGVGFLCGELMLFKDIQICRTAMPFLYYVFVSYRSLRDDSFPHGAFCFIILMKGK